MKVCRLLMGSSVLMEVENGRDPVNCTICPLMRFVVAGEELEGRELRLPR